MSNRQTPGLSERRNRVELRILTPQSREVEILHRISDIPLIFGMQSTVSCASADAKVCAREGTIVRAEAWLVGELCRGGDLHELRHLRTESTVEGFDSTVCKQLVFI